MKKGDAIMIIFLDIDGCLMHGGRKNYKDIDPNCVTIVKHFCDKYEAKIVISSAWRIGRTIEELDFLLFSYGLNKGSVIGKTGYDTTRGKEILNWIKENKYEGKYIVIDDEIFDLVLLPSKNIIHIIDGWNRGGLQQSHIDEWETRP